MRPRASRSRKARATWLRGYVAGVALLALTAGCEGGSAKESKQKGPAAPPPTVIVAEVLQRTVSVSADFVGRTEAVPTVEIRARVQGVLEQVRWHSLRPR